MKVEHIQLLGLVGCVYFPVLFFSFLMLLFRKFGLVFTDEFLIDQSKYEAIGKINWSEIESVKTHEKRNVEVFLKEDVLKQKQKIGLKPFLRFMHNWNFRKSILISDALLQCSIDELFNSIKKAHKENS